MPNHLCALGTQWYDSCDAAGVPSAVLPGKQLKIQGNYMKVSQQDSNFNLFAFIAVHTVTKNYHSGFGFGFCDIKLRRLGVL